MGFRDVKREVPPVAEKRRGKGVVLLSGCCSKGRSSGGEGHQRVRDPGTSGGKGGDDTRAPLKKNQDRWRCLETREVGFFRHPPTGGEHRGNLL